MDIIGLRKEYDKVSTQRDDLLGALNEYMKHFNDDDESNSEMGRWLYHKWIPNIKQLIVLDSK